MLYSRDGDQNIRLEYNEFTYKKTKDTYKLGDRFLKNNFQLHLREFADKKTTYNEVRLNSVATVIFIAMYLIELYLDCKKTTEGYFIGNAKKWD